MFYYLSIHFWGEDGIHNASPLRQRTISLSSASSLKKAWDEIIDSWETMGKWTMELSRENVGAPEHGSPVCAPYLWHTVTAPDSKLGKLGQLHSSGMDILSECEVLFIQQKIVQAWTVYKDQQKASLWAARHPPFLSVMWKWLRIELVLRALWCSRSSRNPLKACKERSDILRYYHARVN